MTRLASLFRDRGILLTGANGFLGKVVLALLLDKFPQARQIYALLRPRPGLSGEERFVSEVLESPPFRPLVGKLGREEIERRVTVLSGDASMPMAGLAPERVREMRGNVGVVLNCAGLVEFFPPVDRSLHANVDTVERLLELCGDLGAGLLHVSTCYVAGEADGLVEETEPVIGFYPRRMGPDDSRFDAADELADCRAAARAVAEGTEGAKRAEALTELGRVRAARWGWVNTYTYAKSLGEQVLASQTSVPYTIVRPAIVESALRYPFPGWVEGGRTAAPLVLMALGGLLDWPARPDLSLEVVPVDLVAAATLAVAGKLMDGSSRRIYQLASSDANPYPLGELIRLLCAEARSNGNRAAPLPRWLDPFRRLRILNARQAARRRHSLRRRLAAARLVLDALGLGARAEDLRVLELQLGFHEQTFEQYMPFILDNRYIFEAGNVRAAYASLGAQDRQPLPWDPERIDWPRYWRECQIPGILRWVQPEAVRKWSFRL